MALPFRRFSARWRLVPMTAAITFVMTGCLLFMFPSNILDSTMGWVSPSGRLLCRRHQLRPSSTGSDVKVDSIDEDLLPLKLVKRSDKAVPEFIKDGHPILIQRTYPLLPRVPACCRCFPYVFFSLTSPNICDDDKPVDLFILVTTSPSAVKKRDAIRKTWASHALNNTSNVRYVFLFGTGWSEKDQDVIRRESLQYGDILQDSYTDSYVNLTFKVLSGYHYVRRKCPRARWVMRGADDVFVNVPSLVKFLDTSGERLQNKMFGNCLKYGGTPKRDKKSKWFVSRNEWPFWKYPPYCYGQHFILSFQTMIQVVNMSPNVPYFVMEDVYFGLVLRALGLRVADQPGFYNFQNTSPVSCKDPTLAVHGMTLETLKLFWWACENLKDSNK